MAGSQEPEKQKEESDVQALDEAAQVLYQKELNALHQRQKKFDRTLWIAILMVLFIVIGLKLVGTPVSVVGSSMEPTYHSGQMLFCIRSYLKAPEIGDVVVAKNNRTEERSYIKRVEGVPGDTIRIQDGVLYRNGLPVEEGFDRIEDAGNYALPYQLKENEYFIMGDNRNDSWDSRFVGTFRKEEIRLVVINGNNQTVHQAPLDRTDTDKTKQ